MNSVWTGIQAQFGFTMDNKSQDDYELRISPGDRIYAQYTDRTLPRPYSTDDHKEIFATSFTRGDLGKPINFDRVDITKSIKISGKHERTEMISTSINAKNDYETNLEVYVIHQITDEEGKVLHIDWNRIFAPAESNFLMNHNCNIIESGEYTVEIFVLNNLENPVPYSEKFTETIII